MLAALKWLEDHARKGTLNTQAYAHAYFPEKTLLGIPNNSQNYQQLERYQEALLGGLKDEGEKGHEYEQNIRGPPRAR
jgi:hypothetical protein